MSLSDDLKSKILKKKKKIGEYIENPKITLIMQFFNHGNIVDLHSKRIKKNALIEEVIICEDGSSDNSLELWHKNLDRRNDIIIRTNDYHELISYNRAAQYAIGEYLCFCQDDDLLPANNIWLQNALSLFEKDSKLGMIGFISCDEFKSNNDIFNERSSGREWYATDKLIRTTGLTIKTKLNDINFKYTCATVIGPVIIKKKIFHEIGGWSSEFSQPGQPAIGLDWDISFKCWEHGYRVGCMPLKLAEEDEYENNEILNDDKFYYRYGFRGTIEINNEVRSAQFKKNIKILHHKLNSIDVNFVSKIYNNVKMLNSKLDI